MKYMFIVCVRIYYACMYVLSICAVLIIKSVLVLQLVKAAINVIHGYRFRFAAQGSNSLEAVMENSCVASLPHAP